MSILAIPNEKRHKIVSGADLINTGRFPKRAPKEQVSRGAGATLASRDIFWIFAPLKKARFLGF